jgi:hypothetical protein
MNNSNATDKLQPPSGAPLRPRGRRRGRASGFRAFLQTMPAMLWFFTSLGILWACLTPNVVLTLCSLLMIPLLFGLLWFEGEPPILLFACGMQWLQATAAIFYCDVSGTTLADDLIMGGVKVEEATWLSMAGILVLAAGMRLALLKKDNKVVLEARQEARQFHVEHLFIFYLVSFVFSSVLNRFAFAMPGLAQPLLALGTLRWIMAFLLVYAVVLQRRHYGLLGVAVGLEVVSGFIGFFSEFKSIFYILLLVLPASGMVIKGWRLFPTLILTLLVLGFSIFWTAIKPEYRDFLNQGTGQQVVNMPVEQRLTRLGELATSMTPATFEQGFEDLILRVTYVHYFDLTIQNVPANVPYERGQLWWGCIKQIIMPRLFFPKKAVLDDSARAAYYTGTPITSAEEGASIGIGYFGESYIDFGPVGMFAPIFLLGIFYGLIYRLFISRAKNKVIGFAIAVSILLFNACEIETSNIKILGGTVCVCLVMALFLRFGEQWLWNALTRQPGRLPRRKKAEKLKTETLKAGNRGD